MKFEIDKNDILNMLDEKYGDYNKKVSSINPNSDGILQVEINSEDDWRTNNQISCIKSLCSYFQKAKLKDSWLADDYLDEFKHRAGMNKFYCIIDSKGKVRRYNNESDMNTTFDFIEYKSCANATKKELNIVIDRIIAYTEVNLEVGNFGTYTDKVWSILDKIKENSRIKTEKWKKEQNILKEINKHFN